MNGVGLSKPKSVDNNHNWLILLNFISEMRKIEMSPAQCRLNRRLSWHGCKDCFQLHFLLSYYLTFWGVCSSHTYFPSRHGLEYL